MLKTFLTFAFCAFATAAIADIQYSTVEGYGGVPLVVAESGKPDGRPIVFVHGYSQSILSWKKQLNDKGLGDQFRLIAVDLRGHGASGKPWQPDAYGTKPMGEDLAAVLVAMNVKKPILVGWSYAGEVLMSYIRYHGTENISGLVLVAAGITIDGPMTAPNTKDPKIAALMQLVGKMWSPDVAANIDGTRQFVSSLASKPLPEADLQEALIYNMLTPAYVRQGMRSYLPNNADLKSKLTMPIMIMHGNKDAVAPYDLSVANQKLLPKSKLVTYDGIGHAPFLEDPARFNADIAAFAAK